MAAGITPAAPPKRDCYEYTEATELSYKLPAVSQSTKSFQLLHPAFLKKKQKTKNRSVVTLLLGQDSEPGGLVGLPYIIGDLTYILASIGLSHIEQSQHFCIGTINPRVLEQTENNVQLHRLGSPHSRKTAPGPVNSSTEGPRPRGNNRSPRGQREGPGGGDRILSTPGMG